MIFFCRSQWNIGLNDRILNFYLDVSRLILISKILGLAYFTGEDE